MFDGKKAGEAEIERHEDNMNASEVEAKVQAELRTDHEFDNSHGITKENLHHFLVKPYSVHVDPDDLESAPRDMWVVLRELPGVPDQGYAIAYDPATGSWAVIEPTGIGFVQVIGASTLAEALEGM